ncbi:MAG: DUF4349 domain-containing protein [Lachnospiraceae bacterium]
MGRVELMKTSRRFFTVLMATGLFVTGCGATKFTEDMSRDEYASEMMNGSYGVAMQDSVSKGDFALQNVENMGLSYEGMMADEGEMSSSTTGEGFNPAQNTEGTASDSPVLLSQEKMIYRTNITAETLTFDETYAGLKQLLSRYDCIIANENVTNAGNSYMYSGYKNSRNGYTTERECYIEIRVPVENYKNLLENVEALGNVTSKNSNATNITRSYYDTQAELRAYEDEYIQLEKLMATATLMEDILEITDQMTMVRSQINRLKSNLTTMDMDVAYSYINLTLTEVVEYTQPEVVRPTLTFWDRFVHNFEDSYTGFLEFLEEFLFFIIRILPYVILAGILYFIYRKTPLYRRNKERRERKGQQGTRMKWIKPGKYSSDASDAAADHKKNASSKDDK